MRALLIEDDSAVANSIELMLKSAGLNLYTTDLAEEGIDLGKIYDYDIIVLDLSLPDMSGFEVLRKLRASKVGSPIRRCPANVKRSIYQDSHELSISDDPNTVMMRGGSAIVDPLGRVLAGPDFTGEAIFIR